MDGKKKRGRLLVLLLVLALIFSMLPSALADEASGGSDSEVTAGTPAAAAAETGDSEEKSETEDPADLTEKKDSSESGGTDGEEVTETEVKTDPTVEADLNEKETTDENPVSMTAAAPLAAAAATVETADTSGKITLNLFNYSNASVNAYKSGAVETPFKFTGDGLAATGALVSAGGVNYMGMNSYTGNLGNYDHYAVQGIVQNKLVSGYPMTQTYTSPLAYSAFSLNYLFNPEIASTIGSSYTDLNHLFTYNTATETYSYDSAANYASYDTSQGDDGDFTVYSTPYANYNSSGQLISSNKNYGFWPFNSYSNDSMTYHFGVTMESGFSYPENGKINDKDMVFSFSGDDDVWVYIDDVLVLDLGGIHGSASGSINFATGAVELTNNPLQVGSSVESLRPNTGVIGQSSTIQKIFQDAGATWDNSTGSTHTIKFYYLERGAGKSNCAMSFNLPVQESFNVSKQWSDGSQNHTGESVTYTLYRQAGANAEKETVGTYTLNAANNWTITHMTETYYDSTTQKDTAYLYSVDESKVSGYTTSIDNNGGISSGTITITNTKELTADLNIHKTDSSGTDLEGAVFSLTPAGGTEMTGTSGADGTLSFPGLSAGDYILKETSSPDNHMTQMPEAGILVRAAANSGGTALELSYYSADGSVQLDSDELDAYGLTVEDDGTLTIVNPPDELDLNLVKKNSDGTFLAGAEFTLYSDAACTNAVATAESVSSDVGAVFSAKITSGAVYYLKETRAPQDYTLDQTVYTITAYNKTSESLENSIIGGSRISISAQTTDGTATITAVNYEQTPLPLTGGSDSQWYLMAGLIVFACAGLLILRYFKAKRTGGRA